MGKKSEQSRLDYLDVAKGIGMILVVMSHTAEQFPNYTDLIVAFFMPLFFIISGWIYKEKQRSLLVSIRHRTARLLFPYFIYSALLYAIWLFKNLEHLDASRCKTALFGILYSRYSKYPLNFPNNTFYFIINNHPLWFLTAMFIASILAIIALRISKKFKIFYVLFMGAFLYISYAFMKVPQLLPWSVDTAFLGAFFIMAGYLIGKLFKILEKKPWTQIFVFIPMYYLWVEVTKINGMANMSVREYGYKGYTSLYLFAITGIAGSLVLILVSKLIALTILKKPFCLISKESIVVLAMHPVFLEWFDRFIGTKITRVPGSSAYWAYSYIKVFVTIFVCIGLKCLFNMIKKWLLTDFSLGKTKVLATKESEEVEI